MLDQEVIKLLLRAPKYPWDRKRSINPFDLDNFDKNSVDGTKGLVELLASLAASIKHLDRSNSNTENINEEFRKELEN